MPLQIGPTTHSKGGELKFGYYGPDAGDAVLRVAMWVDGQQGREYVATVNCDGPAPSEGTVYLKGWSENEGVPEALVKAGAVRLVTDEWRACGYSAAQKAELTQASLDELAVQMPKRPPLRVRK